MAAWAEAMASVWSYRLGTERGADFTSISIADWVEQALTFRERPAISGDAGHTCHMNACDGSGSLVAMTLTHGPYWFGGRWVVPDTGIIMNSGMPLFASTPAVNVGSRAYGVTNMAPTVVRTQDGAAIAVGCPGARRIPSIIGLALGRHLFGGFPIQRAVSEVRFHAETHARVSIEMGHAHSALKDAFRKVFPQVEDEDPDFYYGPLTALRRDAVGLIEFGLDDRWKGTGLLA
jgi:gamma-glutamyltranspeptidase/glutathione hydrolase